MSKCIHMSSYICIYRCQTSNERYLDECLCENRVTLFKVSEFEETTCLFFSSRCTFCRSANRSWHEFVFANNKLIGSLISKMCVLPSLSLSCSLGLTSWLIFSGFYTHTHTLFSSNCLWFVLRVSVCPGIITSGLFFW